jgi:hypothetical protein
MTEQDINDTIGRLDLVMQASPLETEDDEAAFDERLKKLGGAPRVSIATLERRLANAQAEAAAWKGKPGERYKMALALVRGLEKQLQAAQSISPE